jgi:hypothetical protein
MSTEGDGKLPGMQESVPVGDVRDSCAEPPDKPLTAAQRRGLARKITAYLKRSGLDCELIGEPRQQPHRLN